MTTNTTQLARGAELHRAGALAEAEALYRDVLEHEPANPGALSLLGVVCGQTGRGDEAEQLLRSAVAIGPSDAVARSNLGTLLVERGALDEALDAFRAAARLEPGHARAHRQLARLLIGAGRYEEAVEPLEVLLRLDASLEDRLDLGIARHLAGDHEAAVAILRVVTSRDPSIAAAWCNLGLALRASGERDEAVVALERAIALDPALASASANLALVQLELGDPTAALNACRGGLRADDASPLLHRTMARVQRSIGEHAAAESHLRRAIELERDSVLAHVELAETLRRLGRIDEAEATLVVAAALDPDHVPAHAGRVELCLARGDRPAALDLAESTLVRFPHDVSAVHAAATARLAAGRPGAAASLLETACAEDDAPTAQRRMLLFALGTARDRTGDHEVAWDAFAEANRLRGARFDRPAFEKRMRATMSTFGSSPLAALPRSRPVTGVRPVFIAGVPRCGSTLVEQIIDSHPGAVGVGESGLMERLENRLPGLLDRPFSFPDDVPTLTPDEVERAAATACALLGETAGPAHVVVEKSLSNAWYLGLVEMLFPDARVVLCERARLDTCLSCFFHDFMGHLPWAYDLEDIGFFHRWHERLARHWARSLSRPVLTVRYEETVRDTETTARHLLEHCGLEWDGRCLDFHRNDRVVLTSSADQVRQPIYTRSIGRYRHYERHLEPLRRALRLGSTRDA